MAKKKSNRKNTKALATNKKTTESTPDGASSRASKAEQFIKNLGPDGYMNVSETLSKDIFIERYSMSTPDGATPLLDNVEIKLVFGRKYGLVGKNGHGKTTLLNNMAGYEIEKFPTHVRVMHVKQEVAEDDSEVIDAVLKADVIRTQLIEEANRLESIMYDVEDDDAETIQNDLDKLALHMEKLKISDSQAKAYKILAGLGFSKQMQREKVNALSGGWQMRVQLAKALFVAPDLLLLDEPTNHLDFPAVLWLQQYLKNEFDKTLIVVSHDKMFLNDVISNVIHLDHKKKSLKYYKGNYEAFELAKKEQFKTLVNEHRAIEFQINSLQEFVAKFKDKGEKRAAQVQSKLKTLKKLEDSLPPKPVEEKPFAFRFPEPRKLEQLIVSLTDVCFSYVPGKPVLRNINLAVDMDSRVGVIGANGVGKSTLIKIMLQQLVPISGQVEKNSQAHFAYFSQHHYDQLDLATSAVEYLLETFRAELAEKPDRVQFVRRHLGRFGIKGDRQNQTIRHLSGGQKSRVAFAVLTFRTPHFIVMDEPTNHLDLETVDALASAIESYKGGVLLISHDTHFLSKAARTFWSVTPEKIVRFDDFEEAKQFALKKRIDEIDAA